MNLSTEIKPCVFCNSTGGELIVQTPQYRIIWANEAGYPFYIRLVWQAHVKEFSDLSENDAQLVFQLLLRIEAALRQTLNPDKINIASFGNLTPHLHWHVIARWLDDAHWPQPNWGAVQRQDKPWAEGEIKTLRGAVAQALCA